MPCASLPPSGRPAVHRALLWLLVAVFLLQRLARGGPGPGFWEHCVALSLPALQRGCVWTILSYALLHHGALHLLLNGLTLHCVGSFLRWRLRPRHFLGLFGTATLAGALLWLCFRPSPVQRLAGASAGILGLLAYACLCAPQYRVTVLLFGVFPLRLQLRTLLGLLFVSGGLGLLFGELSGRGHIAHSAHLGGLIAGVLYFFALESLSRRR